MCLRESQENEISGTLRFTTLPMSRVLSHILLQGSLLDTYTSLKISSPGSTGIIAMPGLTTHRKEQPVCPRLMVFSLIPFFNLCV